MESCKNDFLCSLSLSSNNAQDNVIKNFVTPADSLTCKCDPSSHLLGRKGGYCKTQRECKECSVSISGCFVITSSNYPLGKKIIINYFILITEFCSFLVSGETAFKNMNVSYGWAKFPMIDRISDVDKNIPITMIHGSESWISVESSYQTKYLRKDSFVDIRIIVDAGHHVYADQPDNFNKLVDKICRKEDRKTNAVTH